MGRSGKLIVITGPMFSGKTTRLLKEVRKASKNKKAVLFRSAMDKRYSATEVVSHDGMRLPAMTLESGQGCISTLKEVANDYDVIAIDEGQFWQETGGFADALDDLAYGSKRVYVAMLNKDANGNPFRISKDLLPLADTIYCLESKCSKCKGKANFSQRIMNGIEVHGDDFVVGGSDVYEPRCRKHFVRPGNSRAQIQKPQ